MPPYLVLLRAGFAQPAGHPTAGALLPHHLTLTAVTPMVVDQMRTGWRCVSVRYPSGHPAWELPSALSRGARTFLDRRAASTAAARRPGNYHSSANRARIERGPTRLASVQGFVCQCVGALVEMSADVRGLEAVELVSQPGELIEERFQGLVADAVASLELPHDQFGIEAQFHGAGAALKRRFHRGDGAVVFGHVVGRAADPIAPGVEFASVGVVQDGAVGGWTWIAARRAVGVGDEMHVRELSGRGTRFRALR